MFINMTRAAVVAVAMTMPVAMHAQRGGGMGMGSGVGPRLGRMGGGNPVAPLIDMRRDLNLTTRQLVQLDSIERSLIERNSGLREQLRVRMDSMRPRRRDTGEAEIQRLRAEGDSLRALRQVIARNDSVAGAAAMAILTDAQRTQVRERRAFEAGRRSAMRGGARGFRGRQGGERFGPRMRQRGPGVARGGMGVRPGDRMRGPDAFGPRGFDNRRPTQDDSLAPRRFRRPPPNR
jgi:hypothetical protein